MATENVRINVRQTGAGKASKSMAGLGLALAGVGLMAKRAGSALAQSADDYTKLTNQTKVFSSSQEDAAFRMQETIRIAREMNSSITGVGEVMQRISLAQKSAGIDSQQVAKIAENLQKAAMLGGATSQEAEGALRQFGQGLAANRLSGQELNSVLEQTPVVAQVIADHMGVSVGALKSLGEQGKLTTKVLVAAFSGSLPQLQAMFDKYEWSFEQLGTSVSREATLLSAVLLKEFGATDFIKGKMKDLTTSLMTWSKVLEDGGKPANDLLTTLKAWGSFLGGGALTLAIIGVGSALYFALGAIGPFALAIGGIAFIVGGAVASLVAFWDTGFELGGGMVTVGALISRVFERIQLAIKVALDFWVKSFQKLMNALDGFLGGFKIFGDDSKGILTSIVSGWTDMLAVILAGGRSLHQLGTDGWSSVTWNKNFKDAKTGIEKELFDTEGIVVRTFDDISAFLTDGVNTGSFMDALFGAEWLAKLDTDTKAAMELLAQTKVKKPLPIPGGGGDGAGSGPSQALMDDFLDLQHELDPLLEALDQMAEKKLILDEVFAAGIIPPELFDQLNEKIDEKLLPAIEKLQRIEELGGEDSFWVNFADSAGVSLGQVTSMFETLGEVAGSTMQSLASGVADFAMNTDKDMGAWALNMVEHIGKVIIQTLILKAIQAAMGGIGGGSTPGASSLNFGSGSMGTLSMPSMSSGMRATGGPVGAGKAYLVGEKGPEMFVPPSGGSIKDARATAAAPAAPRIQIVNVDDPESVPSAMNSEAGEQVIINILQRNPEALRGL